jgi:DNA repair protein RadA/Sms
MVKSTAVFVCGQCGYESVKWLGKCPSCQTWSSFSEEKRNFNNTHTHNEAYKAVPLTDISMAENTRFSSGNAELDRVLGGGIVPGSLILLGGDPGVGKSTLLLQVAQKLADNNYKILYLTGEESLRQIKLRAERLKINADNIFLLNEQKMEILENCIQQTKPHLVIIDSIQTVYTDSVSSIPGSVTQLRECTVKLAEIAKKTERSLFLIGHVTKDGALAGPKVLEHMVDVVIYFEGEKNFPLRILRSVKNRYGSTDEIGFLEMGESGLQEVQDPSYIFLDARQRRPISGLAVCPIYEGSRPFLIEVQALVTSSGPGYARRMASGIDQNRLALIIAVLEKRLSLSLGNQDIYVKISGGFFLKDPAADLGVAAAIISSYQNFSLPADTVFAGEVSLSGMISKVSFWETRLKEAERMGYKKAVIPEHSRFNFKEINLELMTIENISDLLKVTEV